MEIKGLTLPKPRVGEPCNGCGLCCHIQLCNTGAFLLKKSKVFGAKVVKGKCPALMDNEDGSFSCGLIKNPKKYIRSKFKAEVISRTVATLIGAGGGCDELGLDPDPIEELDLEIMIGELTQDEAWREKATKAVELLHKF